MSSGNQSVERAMSVLKTLSAHGGLGVTEIARRLQLPKSIAYRLLVSLRAADLVRVDAASRRYSLGYGLLQMTADWLGQIDVRNVALPHLRLLRQQTNETVALNLRDGDQRVTVERLDTSFEVRFVIDLGRPRPMYVGAAGKAILAFLPAEEIDEVLGRAELKASDRGRVAAELAEIRQHGFAATCGERVAGSRSISAPIRDHTGAAVASVSVLSLESRMPVEQVGEIGRLVRQAGESISSEMGFAPLSSVA